MKDISHSAACFCSGAGKPCLMGLEGRGTLRKQVASCSSDVFTWMFFYILDWWRHLKWFLATLGGEDPRLFQNPGGGGLTNNRFQRDDVCGRRGSGKT